MSRKCDSRAVGLDVGLGFSRWLTGAENLHYGLWTGLEVSAANLRAAQDAYTAKLLTYLPAGCLRILDIGGGAGVTARKLVALGHKVEIVVPSAILAGRCRVNAPEARVHECTFEDFTADERFDVCLFSESFQYVPLDIALGKALSLLGAGGVVVIADCFRSEAYRDAKADGRKPGGGHYVGAFRDTVSHLPVKIDREEDIADAVAPSIDLEQGLFNVIGDGLVRLDAELAARRPWVRRVALGALRRFLSRRRSEAILRRLTLRERTSEAFVAYNRYLMLRLVSRP